MPTSDELAPIEDILSPIERMLISGSLPEFGKVIVAAVCESGEVTIKCNSGDLEQFLIDELCDEWEDYIRELIWDWLMQLHEGDVMVIEIDGVRAVYKSEWDEGYISISYLSLDCDDSRVVFWRKGNK